MTEINELQKRAYQHALHRGWLYPSDTIEAIMQGALLRIYLEVGEAADAYREGHPPIYIGHRSKPEGWAIELADVVSRAMELLGHAGIDIEDVMVQKQDYNIHQRRYSGRAMPF